MKKTLTPRVTAAIVGGLYLVSFLAFYIPNYAIGKSADWWEYIRYFLGELVGFISPALVGLAVFVFHRAALTWRSYLGALLLSAPRAVYTLPYYYLMALAYGFDSLEGVAISIPVSLLYLLFDSLIAFLYCLIIRFTVYRMRLSELMAALPPLKQKEKPEPTVKNEAMAGVADAVAGENPYDTASPVNRGILITLMIQLAVSVIRELTNTVSYLIDYAGSYRLGEIIYITISYVFILLSLLISQLVLVKLYPHFERK